MGHDHPHDRHHHAHSHGTGHSHAPAPRDMGRAFAIGVALNSAFVLTEAGAGLWTGSLALLADAGHNLSDVLALLLAWGAVILAKRPPSTRRTYGMRKATVLASLANGVLLLVAVGAIAAEAIRRFAEPSPVATGPVVLVAAIGVVINTATALMFMRGRKEDLNARGAFLHMAADAGVSLAVVVGALAMGATGLLWIDPVLSLIIVAVILIGTWDLLSHSVNLALDAVPQGIDAAEVRAWLSGLPDVSDVHDLHIWAMSTTETAMTAHLTRGSNADGDAFLHTACEGLAHRFGIGHATLQVETGAAEVCPLAHAEAV